MNGTWLQGISCLSQRVAPGLPSITGVWHWRGLGTVVEGAREMPDKGQV